MRFLIIQSVITWALVQNSAGNLVSLSSTGTSWYPPSPYPPRPILTPPLSLPPSPQPLCWGSGNTVNPLFPFPLGPNGGGAAGECACSGYSIQVCPLAVPSSGGGQIREIIDENIVEQARARVIAEERDVVDVTNQYYPSYNPYPYYTPSPPQYPYYPSPAYQIGASRSLGDE